MSVQSPGRREPATNRLGRGPWREYTRTNAAGSRPTAQAACVSGGSSEDMAWAAYVVDSGGALVDGRTFTVMFGRQAGIERPGKVDGGVVYLNEEEATASPASAPSLVYLQPCMADDLYAYVSDVGDVNVGNGEQIVILFKPVSRVS